MEQQQQHQPRFELGDIVVTVNAEDTLASEDIEAALSRHERGDWGCLCESDRQQNEVALRRSGRLFSEYQNSKGRKFWVITEADRSVTTVLLPDDY